VNGCKLLADTPATLNESGAVRFGSETPYRDGVPMRNPFNFLVTGVRDILRTVTDHEAPQTQEDDHAAIQAASTEIEADLGHEQQSAAATKCQTHPANVPGVPQQTVERPRAVYPAMACLLGGYLSPQCAGATVGHRLISFLCMKSRGRHMSRLVWLQPQLWLGPERQGGTAPHGVGKGCTLHQAGLLGMR